MMTIDPHTGHHTTTNMSGADHIVNDELISLGILEQIKIPIGEGKKYQMHMK